MKRFTTALAASAIALSLAGGAYADNTMVGGVEMLPTNNVVENASNAPNLTTLVSAVKAAGLVETLMGPGPFTVFAPTNAAFAKLPEKAVADLLKPENKKQLQAILKHHVVAGKVMSSKAVKLSEAMTINGTKLPLKFHRDSKTLHVGQGKVVAADVEAKNGVIHVVDTVLLPK